MSIRYVAGTIDVSEVDRFRRILFRSSRGKVLSFFDTNHIKINDFQGHMVEKAVYVLCFEEG